MTKFLSKEIDILWLLNPFYIYCFSFGLALVLYLWGWSSIYPELSGSLIVFLLLSFIIFAMIGKHEEKKFILKFNSIVDCKRQQFLNDIIFFFILCMGILNVLLMGYLPILERSKNHLDFGISILDPLFHSMSIFFSIFFFQSYLEIRKKRNMLYIILILLFQLIIFRRSAVIWILGSSLSVYLLFRINLSIRKIILFLVCLPLFSFLFGGYGALRSNLSKSYVLEELGASETFVNSGLNYNHYLTYLYISSPLANLQKNIDESDGFFSRKDFKNFFYFSIIPYSITSRLENDYKLIKPQVYLIHPHLTVGTFFVIGYYLEGWLGMIIMLLFLVLFILFSKFVIVKCPIVGITTFSILLTTIALLIFSNFLNLLDVILMLFVYPFLFNIIINRNEQIRTQSVLA